MAETLSTNSENPHLRSSNIIDRTYAIKSPGVGTFVKALCEVGDIVSAEQCVAHIEILGIIHEITAEQEGKVFQISCELDQAIQYGQTLLIIEIKPVSQ